MMGKDPCILAGSKQAHEALSYYLLDPNAVIVTTIVVHPSSS